MAAKSNKGLSILKNMGKQIVGRRPVSLKNKNKILLTKAVHDIRKNMIIEVGSSDASAVQARAILMANGIEPVNNLTDSQNGADFTLMVKLDGQFKFEKIEPEDLNVYGKVLQEKLEWMKRVELGVYSEGQKSIEIPGKRSDDDPLFEQDSAMSDNQSHQINIQFKNENENTPDLVQLIDLGKQVALDSGACGVAFDPDDASMKSNPGKVQKIEVNL